MSNKLKITMLLALVPLMCLAPRAAADEDAGTSSPFVLGAGGRGISMGGAASAVWGDSYSLLWNPAGLYYVERGEATFFHTSLFDESTTYSSLLLSQPFLDIGVISVGAIQLRVGGIERRDADNRIIADDSRNIQSRYYIGYSRDFISGFTAGLDLKIDRFAQGSWVASGFGIDAGLGLKTAVRSPAADGLALGLALQNIVEPSISLVSQEAGDPRTVRIGFGIWRSIAGADADRLLVAFDFDKSRYSETHLHVGGEYELHNTFMLRGGWDAGIPTFGCGLQYRFAQLDYAYRNTDLGGNHLFSLLIRFGASRSDKVERRRRREKEEMQRQIEGQISQYEGNYVSTSLEQGEILLREGRFEEAVDNFQKVLLWAPDNGQAKRGLLIAEASKLVVDGDSLKSHRRYGEAMLCYQSAYEKVQAPEIHDKILLIKKSIEFASDRQRMIQDLLGRALELYTERKWAESIIGFEEILKLSPDHEIASPYIEKAREKVRESYDRVIRRSDQLVTQGRHGAAVEILRAGLEEFPGNETIQQKLARLQQIIIDSARKRDEGRHSEPARQLTRDEIERLRPNYDRGIEHFRSRNFEQAIEEWKIVWNTYSSFEKVTEYLLKAYQYRGMELYAEHRYHDALALWENMLKVDPDNEKALRYISRTREELGKLEGLVR